MLVRSVRGPRGRWYRECVANPSCAVVVADRQVATTAEMASDPDRVEACSRALRAKYARWRSSLAAMLVEETLGDDHRAPAAPRGGRLARIGLAVR